MPLVRYVAGKNPADAVAAITVEVDDDGAIKRQLALGGVPQEISDDQFAALKDRYELEVVQSGGGDKPQIRGHKSDGGDS